jgi:hypothetical protein
MINDNKSEEAKSYVDFIVKRATEKHIIWINI